MFRAIMLAIVGDILITTLCLIALGVAFTLRMMRSKS